jgi:hypothetical protein
MSWTYGAEHELGDWDRRLPLPDGWNVDRRDVTIVNSNGIAADPKGVVYRYGGEFNTPPSNCIEQQLEHMRTIWRIWPNACVNYRSNLHIHIRVPGLRDDLATLKRIAQFNYEWLPRVLPIIEPIPLPTGTGAELAGATRRYRRRLVSHQTVVKDVRLEKQLCATTLEEFLGAECPMTPSGVVQWHLAPRHAINLRQLRETDTLEFRHFPGTLSTSQLYRAFTWCRDYLACALDGGDPIKLWEAHYSFDQWPMFEPYVHWQEVRYRATCHDGTNTKTDILKRIAQIEAGTFDGQHTLCLSGEHQSIASSCDGL